MPHLADISQNLASPLPIFHLWSIAVEEQFYLLWPFILYWCWHRKDGLGKQAANNRSIAKQICLAVFIGSLLFRLVIWHYTRQATAFAQFLLTQSGGLAAGGWLALAHRGSEWKRVVRLAPIAVAGGLVGFGMVGLITHSFETNTSLMMTLGLSCVTILFAGIVALTLQPSIFERFFSMGWLRWLGNISYGLYIFHILLLPVIGYIARMIADGKSRMVLNGVEFVVAAALSLVCSTLSFALYESQFLRLKKYFVSSANAASLR